MERTVTLKVINRGLVQKTEVVNRFHREAKAAVQLYHPNIVTAYDAHQAGDFHLNSDRADRRREPVSNGE